MTMVHSSRTETEFFMSIEDIGDHWIWRGQNLLRVNPVMRIGKDIRAASWVGWEINENRRVPVGYILQRTCEFKMCVNPDHRELIRKGENEEVRREEVTGVSVPSLQG